MSKKISPTYYPWIPVDLPVFRLPAARCFGVSVGEERSWFGSGSFRFSFTGSLKHRAAKPQPKHRAAGNRFMEFLTTDCTDYTDGAAALCLLLSEFIRGIRGFKSAEFWQMTKLLGAVWLYGILNSGFTLGHAL